MARPRDESARNAVLAAMLRALAEHGFDAVTIEGLAADAGVSKQTIYRWWPSKAAILGEALLEGDMPLVSHFPDGDDLEADLRAWLRLATAGGSREAVAVARALIAITATDHELGLALNARLAGPIREWVAARFARALEAGQVRPGLDVAAIAEQLIGLSSYVTLLGLDIASPQVDAWIDVLMRGVEAD